MAGVTERTSLDLDEPVLIEGLPGVGLVGKIAADHLVDSFDMTYYASVTCEGLPEVAVYGEDDPDVRPPVRIHADEDRDLLVLQSDIPVSRTAASDFANCVTDWLVDKEALPLYLSGLPVEDQAVDEVPDVFGVATGSAGAVLGEHGIDHPGERGVVGGPTGALLHAANDVEMDALGVVVESDPQFPDPAAARKAIVEGINPIAGVDAATDTLVDQAEDIRDQKQRLAQRMQEANEDEASQAKPLRMYQ